MISTAWRFVPSCASHSRHSRRPSIATGRPFDEVLRAALALVAPDGDVEVVRLLGPLRRSSSLRRVLTAMRRLQTAVPAGVWRSSGSRRQVADEHDAVDVCCHGFRSSPTGRVQATPRPRRCHRRTAAAAAAGAARRSATGAFVWPTLDAPERAVAHDAVGDLEHARDLGERLGGRGEEQQVVDRLALVVDLVREPAAAPRLVAVPGAARALDGVADALDDLVRPLFGELRVQQQHDFVVVQQPEFLLLMD